MKWRVQLSSMKRCDTHSHWAEVSHERKVPGSTDGVWRYRIYAKEPPPDLSGSCVEMGEKEDEDAATKEAEEALARRVKLVDGPIAAHMKMSREDERRMFFPELVDNEEPPYCDRCGAQIHEPYELDAVGDGTYECSTCAGEVERGIKPPRKQ